MREKLIDSDEVDSITGAEADELSPHASIIVGTNAREQAQRAKRFLDWTPKDTDIQAEIARCVLDEARMLGIK